ncbi:GtrA family protein [Pseudomonas sp. W17]|uniref:GtrA family protein n=1 Tax=Pseudomonas sp. W17 TaxID=3144407 RepID=A0AAU7X303_9PSED
MIALAIQTMKFLLVGVLNTLTGLAAIYAIMYFTSLGPLTANAVGYAVGLAISFTLNSIWTFKSTNPARHSLPKYILCAIIAYLLNAAAVLLALNVLKINPYIAQLCGIVIYSTVMFIACKLLIFKNNAS